MRRTTKGLLLILAAGTLAFANPTPIPPSPATSPLPQSYSNLDYLSNFSYPFQNLLCPSGASGCGGAFQTTISDGPAAASTPSTLATVWCVDYQLDVTYGSQYPAIITNLANISMPTDNSVRYGNLNDTGGSPGWANAVTDPTSIDGNETNSAAYRYTLAAALVSQYEGPGTGNTTVINPTNLDGYSSGNADANSRNIAIQEAIWYITYNNDYQPGATWPPYNLTTSGTACLAGSGAPTGGAADNPLCWVQYAEANANSVNTGAWAVISAPADVLNGSLENPQLVGGYPSYQTFLVQVSGTGQTGGLTPPPVPEPGYYVLLGIFSTGLFLFSRFRRAKTKA